MKRFEKAKDEAAKKRFDELSVINITRELYEDLKEDNEEVFLDLAESQYLATKERGDDPPDKSWLFALLLAYGPVTKYIYMNEVDRKRDRTTEAVNASSAKVTEFRKGLSYWVQMTGQMLDDITDEAILKAYSDAGIKKIRWKTQTDGRECKICKDRNNRVYPIKNIPAKPHWRCRCTYEPVK